MKLHAVEGLCINEIMAENSSTITDSSSEYDDWIELYNSSEKDIDLNGLYLSDDIHWLTKFKLMFSDSGTRILKPHTYIILWADAEPLQGSLHCNFRLSREGEELFLVGKDGRSILDKVSFGKQTTDIAFGRSPDGTDNLCLLEASTPAAMNLGERKAKTPVPSFSKNAGLYSGSIQVELSTLEKDAAIYYSTDGSNPSVKNSRKYQESFSLSETRVLRAIAVQPGKLPSDIVTKTFIINSHSTLPVISLVTDPPNLWDQDSGIYVEGDSAEDKMPHYGANYHMDWQKDGHFEFFPHNTTTGCVSNDISLRIAGCWSRAKPKKSFVIETVPDRIDTCFRYSFFSDKKNITQLKKLMLRSDAASGYRIKNELIYNLNKAAHSSVSMQSYLPSVLYLNGKYWGIYNLMESKGSEFIETNYGYQHVDILKNNIVVDQGNLYEYNSLLSFLNSTDLTANSAYSEINRRIDVMNCIDYWFYEIYTGKHDNANIRLWRPKQPNAKWRWISYDMDSWHENDNLFRLTKDTTAYSYRILGALLRNETFRNKCINRFCDLLNFPFEIEHVKQTIYEICDVIRDEMPRDNKRWDENHWRWFIPWINNFVTNRPDVLRQEMIERFSLDDTCSITCTVKDLSSGTVQINSFDIQKDGLWKGIYFKGFSVIVTAVPKAGYTFKGWGTQNLENDQTVTLTLDQSVQLQPIFMKVASPPPEPRIEETPQDSSFSTNDQKIDYNIRISNANNLVIINLQSPKHMKIKIDIFNLNGTLIQTLTTPVDSRVNKQIIWNCADKTRRKVASGSYIFRFYGKGDESHSTFFRKNILFFVQ